ncbi:amidase family protein [Nannocystis sp.]|uniref:amidase n=1 Tax=Nannocystis sp. TaxID=1962667 RepID=UPI002600F486|nr:amidase family protein [Nannocystis sp.]
MSRNGPSKVTDATAVALARACQVDLSADAVGRAREYLTDIIGLLETLREVDVAGVASHSVAEVIAGLHAPAGPAPPDAEPPHMPEPSLRAHDAPWSAWTAWETATALRRGEVSAVMLTQAALVRVAAIDVRVHAWLRIDEDAALATARRLDAARARGEPLGPLAGVPTGLKDNLLTAGLETTAGSRILQGWIPTEDGAHAARLRAAGAVILGKLALDEFGMGSSNENTPFEPVRNPWAPDFVPGGSSGGSAAAVAARTVCFSLGSDSGGSIRQPASLCGLVGLKPTYGRVSRHGLIPVVPGLDHVGSLTRDVRDAALVLGCLAGHDPRDLNSIRAPVPDYLGAVARGRADGIDGMRIGVHHEALALPGLDPAVLTCFMAALAELRAAGAQLVEVSLPHFRRAVPTYYALASAQAATHLARVALPAEARGQAFGEEVRRRLLLGTLVFRGDGEYLERATRVQGLIVRDHAAALERCDVLASPTTRLPGFRLGERVRDPVAMYLSDIFVIGANLAGLPAMSVPAGFAPASAERPSLPVGLHLVARALDETTLLRVAAAHEARTCWHVAVAPGAAG